MLLADDWCETGSQALTAKALIEEAGGEFVGTSIIVDQVAPDVRGLLGRLSALVTYDSLPGDLVALLCDVERHPHMPAHTDLGGLLTPRGSAIGDR